MKVSKIYGIIFIESERESKNFIPFIFTFSLEALSLIQVDKQARSGYLHGPNSVKIRVTTNRSRGSLKEPEQRLGNRPLATVEPYNDRSV